MQSTTQSRKTLLESKGFSNRQPGQTFVDPTNPQDIATFQGLILLPTQQPAADSKQEFETLYEEWRNSLSESIEVYEINRISGGTRAAMIVHMQTIRGTEYFVLFTRDNAHLEGKLTHIPPGVIPNQGGYVLNRAISKSERAGVKPSDVITSNKLYKPSQIPALLEAARATAGDDIVNQMQAYLRAVIKGKATNYRIVDGAQYASVHQKYLGEWAAPLALITAQFSPADQLDAMQEEMLGGNSVSEAKVQYNTHVSSTLVDSAINVSGFEIAISSKAHGGGGAAASLKGLEDTMTGKRSSFPSSFWRNEKNSKFRDIVHTIMSKSAIDGVLDLAADMGIVRVNEKNIIKTSIESLKPMATLTKNLEDLLSDYAANENHNHYNQGKHALAAVARRLCDRLNQEDYTASAKAILSKADMVQMSFVTGVSGADLICKEFRLMWPPQFEGRVNFYSGKSFSATEIKGRLGFKIAAHKDVEDPDESLRAPTLRSVSRDRARQEKNKAVGKIERRGERDRRDPTVPDEIALGRSKKTS